MLNNMYYLSILLTIFALGEFRPVTEKSTQVESEVENNELSKAGIADMLNPLNWNPAIRGNNSAGLFPNSPFQNLLNRTQSVNNVMNDIKLFFVTAQGAIMPASVLTGGFTKFLQGLGNMGNLFGNLGQSVQNFGK
ncbi:unnamed protein product [Ceutorhynchus assimilis]|uniref:Uncharacterized protein n=1 Tax=Ceutorhynchus assimilis TaxID=467358 RepID=A0A9N9MYD8_9CUCU|nr:unnamed protein product [Ceutorhynchus assimilis]